MSSRQRIVMLVFSIGLCIAGRLEGVCCARSFTKESMLPTGTRNCECCTSKLRISVEATDPMPDFSLRSSRRAAMKAAGVYARIPGVTTGQGRTAYALVGDPSLASSESRALFLFRSRSGSWVVSPVLGRRPWLISVAGKGVDAPFEVPATRDWRLWERLRGSSGTEQRLQARLRVRVGCLLPKTPAPTPAESGRQWATTPLPGLAVSDALYAPPGKGLRGTVNGAMLPSSVQTTPSPTPSPSPPSLPQSSPRASKKTHAEPVCRHVELRIRGLEGRPDRDRLRGLTGLYTLFSIDAHNHFSVRYHHLSDQPQTGMSSLGALHTFDLTFNQAMGAWAVQSHLHPNTAGHEMDATVEMAIKSTVVRPEQLGIRRWTYVRGGGFGPVVMVRCVQVARTERSSGLGLTVQLVVAALLDHVASKSIRNAIATALDQPRRMVHISRMTATHAPESDLDATLVTARIDGAHKGDSVDVLASSRLFPLLVQRNVHTSVWNPSLSAAQQGIARQKVLSTRTHFLFAVCLVVAGLVALVYRVQTVSVVVNGKSQDRLCEEAQTLLHTARLQEMSAIVEWNETNDDV